jgi:hypothetical protein
MLVPTDEADSRDVILEVRAGAGGDEASLFAMDLLRMYERYAARQPGWRFELLRCAMRFCTLRCVALPLAYRALSSHALAPHPTASRPALRARAPRRRPPPCRGPARLGG